jgi:hypothetical protein
MRAPGPGFRPKFGLIEFPSGAIASGHAMPLIVAAQSEDDRYHGA